MAFVKKGFSEIYDHLLADSRQRLPELSDFTEGSVIRSLLGSFAYELAVLYDQLDLVYQSAFVDTAAGANLDRVVAVLGIRRNEPDYAAGTVAFRRDPGAREEILIPSGTLVTTEEDKTKTPPKKAYLTTDDARLAPGEVEVGVRVRAEDRGREMTAPAGSVVVMPRPVPGIKSVTNTEPIRFLGRDRETDEELRERAKKALLASGRASTTSIENALLSMPGVRDVRVRERFAGGAGAVPDDRHAPGVVEVYVDGLNTENAGQIKDRIDAVRAAGIYVIPHSAVPIAVEATLRIDTDPRASREERLQLETRARDAVVSFIDRLRMGEPLLFSPLTGEILKINGVIDVTEYEIVTYGFAHGPVILTWSAELDTNILIPVGTLLRTESGREFISVAEPQFLDHAASVEVQATRPGRAGELGAEAAWEPLEIEKVTLTPSNEAPLALVPRISTPGDRRVEAEQVWHRFVPDTIRVAAEDKQLPLHVHVRLPDPASARLAVERAVGDFFREPENLKRTREQRAFPKDALSKAIEDLQIGTFQLDLVAFPFQSRASRDDERIPVSFIERPEPEIIFVYRDRVELGGKLRLVLSLTATKEEQDRAADLVRQAIEAYLESLRPEVDINLRRIQEIAAEHEPVLRVEFQSRECVLLKVAAEGEAPPAAAVLPGRNEGETIRIEPYEKVFLSPNQFVTEV